MEEKWNGSRGTVRFTNEDFGPCGCGRARSTEALSLPLSWRGNEKQDFEQFLSKNKFVFFARGYDYRTFLGDEDGDEIIASCCAECAMRAIELGLVLQEGVE